MRKILAICGAILLLGVCSTLQAEENGSGFNFGTTITPTALEGDCV